LFEEGRIDYHPVFPGKPGIAMIRLNYDRALARHGPPEPKAA
jgi:hypothetical protein